MEFRHKTHAFIVWNSSLLILKLAMLSLFYSENIVVDRLLYGRFVGSRLIINYFINIQSLIENSKHVKSILRIATKRTTNQPFDVNATRRSKEEKVKSSHLSKNGVETDVESALET